MTTKFSRVKALKAFLADLQAAGLDTEYLPKLVKDPQTQTATGIRFISKEQALAEMKAADERDRRKPQ